MKKVVAFSWLEEPELTAYRFRHGSCLRGYLDGAVRENARTVFCSNPLGEGEWKDAG